MHFLVNLHLLVVSNWNRLIALDLKQLVVSGYARERLNLGTRQLVFVRREGIVVHENRERRVLWICH